MAFHIPSSLSDCFRTVVTKTKALVEIRALCFNLCMASLTQHISNKASGGTWIFARKEKHCLHLTIMKQSFYIRPTLGDAVDWKSFNVYVLYFWQQQQEIVNKWRKEKWNCYSKTTSILTVKYFSKKGKKKNTLQI